MKIILFILSLTFITTGCMSSKSTVGQGPVSGAQLDKYCSNPDKLLVIETKQGTMKLQLFDKVAPNHVAQITKFALEGVYNGTTFHRCMKNFMIQGGDPQGTGAGEPGYVIPDEIWEGAHHNERGQLCMANRGKNTNGMQFFIMDGVAKHLDGGYTIFGKCAPEDVILKLTGVEVRGDKSVKPTKINKVVIKRKAAKGDAAKGDGSKPAAAAPAGPKLGGPAATTPPAAAPTPASSK